MKSFEAETLIHARNSTVWEILTDGGNYTVWDSGITRIDGELRNGGMIRVRTRTGGKRTFRLSVRQIPGKMMTWTGGLPLGLFRGVRTFTLTPLGRMTHMHVREDFTGPLLGLLRKTIPDWERAFAGYVPAVKKRAELLGRHEARVHASPGSIRRPAGGCSPGTGVVGSNERIPARTPHLAP